MHRRTFLTSPLALAIASSSLASRAAEGPVRYAEVVPRALQFPRDHGSHPAFRTEWWYVTGWLRTADDRDIGVQVTFFRSRTGIAESSKSAFAPRQLLFAHAAIADPAIGRLRHDQRAGRAGFGLAEASEATTDVHIDDWSLTREGERYRTRIPARDFTLALDFACDQPELLQGVDGVSRKGPLPGQASHYYSVPQLRVTGSLEQGRTTQQVRGMAWLDHEWSSEYLAPTAQGWDWTAINFDDGGAFMAFRIRDAGGGALWAGGSHRDKSGAVRGFSPGEVQFSARRHWRSPRTSFDYPVAFDVHAGNLTLSLDPLFDDQELDARASVGIVYWEGAVLARHGAQPLGRGYLELTGYGNALKL